MSAAEDFTTMRRCLSEARIRMRSAKNPTQMASVVEAIRLACDAAKQLETSGAMSRAAAALAGEPSQSEVSSVPAPPTKVASPARPAIATTRKEAVEAAIVYLADADVIAKLRAIPPSIWRVAQCTASSYGVSVEEMIARSTSLSVLYPRQMAMFLGLSLGSAGAYKIGLVLGNRDHNTTANSARRVAIRLETCEKTRLHGRMILAQLMKK